MVFYPTIEEYWEVHKNDKYNYGKELIPKVFSKRVGASMVRRGAYISAYVGPNGGGKSYAMVNDTLITLNGIKFKCTNEHHLHTKQGLTEGYRKVLSSVRLIDPRTGGDHPLWIPYDDHRRLLSLEHCDILMDEITGIASAYGSLDIPVQVINQLTQLRRRDCYLRWTTPNWARAAKPIREITRAVTFAKGKFPMFEEGRSWPSNALFNWRTYDAQSFESFTVGVRERLIPITFQWHFRLAKKNLVQNVYDTFAEVLVATSTNDAGMCLHCGGKRTIPACRCDRSEVDTEENLLAIGRQFGTNEFFERELAEGAQANAAPTASTHENCTDPNCTSSVICADCSGVKGVDPSLPCDCVNDSEHEHETLAQYQARRQVEGHTQSLKETYSKDFDQKLF